jgi:hypothetical protein
MTDTPQTGIATEVNTTRGEQAANGNADVDHRPRVRHRDHVEAVRSIERSREMITRQTAQQDLEAVETLFTSFADGGREFPFWLVALDTRSALARAREDAAMEAQDALAQADEALVLG